MYMTPDLLADRLGDLIAERQIQSSADPILTIEYSRPDTRFTTGRAYLLNADSPQPPSGRIIITSQMTDKYPDCTVLRTAATADRVYQAALDVLDEFIVFEQTLQKTTDLQSLLSLGARYLNNQLLVIDRSMNVQALSDLEPAQADRTWDCIKRSRRLPDEVVSELAPLYQYSKRSQTTLRERLQKGYETYGVPNVHVDLIDQGTYLGWLVLVGNVSPVSPGTLDLLAQLAEPAVFRMKLLHAETKPDLAFNDYYWQEFLAGRLENKELQLALLRERGWQEHDFYRVIRVLLTEPAQLARISAACPRALLLPGQNAVTLVERANRVREAELTGEQFSQLALALGTHCGISDVGCHVSRLPALYNQAIAASESAQASGKPIGRYAGQALDTLLNNPADPQNRSMFMHPAIHQMLLPAFARYRKYLRTLLLYLENERQLTLTARQLYIHKNSLFYRIGMLAEELMLNLEDPDERLRILLSLKMVDFNNL